MFKPDINLSLKTQFINIFRNIFKIHAFENKLVKLTVGQTPDSFVCKLVPNNYQYKPDSIRYAVRNDIKLKLDISDYLEHAIYFGFKDKAQDELFSLCKPGDIIMDIGTNIGYVLLNFARIVGNSGFVFGFEPNPLTYNKCMENISLNDFSNIKVSNIGLGRETREEILIVPYSRNRGEAYIVSTDPPDAGIKVAITTLDRFVKENQIAKIDLIKIDVEGYEFNVLNGAKETLKKYKPKLFIEVDDNLLKRQSILAKELIEFISSFGYSIVKADTGKKVTKDYNFKDVHFDIICRIQK